MMTRDDIIRMATEAGFPAVRKLSGSVQIGGHSVGRFERLIAIAMKAERAHIQREQEAAAKLAGEFLDKLDATRKELAACQRDAERYRWLREQHWSDDWLCVTYTHSVTLGCDCPSRERLDYAIDQAMKEQRT